FFTARCRVRFKKSRVLAQLVVISPDVREKKMAFLNAGDNSRFRPGGSLRFVLRYRHGRNQTNRSRLAEIAKLLKNDPSLRLHVVGHTDNQGKPFYNLGLSH